MTRLVDAILQLGGAVDRMLYRLTDPIRDRRDLAGLDWT